VFNQQIGLHTHTHAHCVHSICVGLISVLGFVCVNLIFFMKRIPNIEPLILGFVTGVSAWAWVSECVNECVIG